MKNELNANLRNELDKLSTINKTIIETGKNNITSGKGFYQFDLFLIPLLNKSLNLNTGYINLIENGNFITAGALVRIQLDNLLRIYAPTLIDINVDEFASQILGGKKLVNRQQKVDR